MSDQRPGTPPAGTGVPAGPGAPAGPGTPPVGPGTPASATGEEDPLAADRRTLAIGAASVAGFVLIGVVSAQLFVTGGCASFGEPRVASAESVPVGQVLDVTALDELDAAFGFVPDRALVVPGDAQQLALLPDGPLVVGDTVTAVRDPFDARLELEVPHTVVGDGATVFDVNVANELTGQVDAFTPVAGFTLEPGSCTDTAVVSEQFAFLLDAGDGQLLQLRLDEDGDDPVVELRDRQGVVSEVELTLPAGPAGVLAERVTARTGDGTVVVGRRVAADDPGAAIVVADAATGERRVEVDLASLRATLDEQGVADELGPDEVPLAVEVLAVVDGRAWLAVRGAPGAGTVTDDDAVVSALATLDLADGALTVRTTFEGRPFDAAVSDAGTLVVGIVPDASEGTGEDARVTALVVTDDGTTTLGPVAGEPAGVRADGVPVLLTATGYAVAGDDGTVVVDDPVVDVRDVRLLEDRTLVLVHVEGRSVLLSD